MTPPSGFSFTPLVVVATPFLDTLVPSGHKYVPSARAKTPFASKTPVETPESLLFTVVLTLPLLLVRSFSLLLFEFCRLRVKSSDKATAITIIITISFLLEFVNILLLS